MNNDKLIIRIHEETKYVHIAIDKLEERFAKLEKCFNKHLINHSRSSLALLKYVLGFLIGIPGAIYIIILLIQKLAGR